jgi:hypothetical protein
MDQLALAFLSLRTGSTRKLQTSKLTLRTLAAVCLLVDVRCSPSTSNPNYRIAELERACEQISERERQCVDAAKKREESELYQRETTQRRDNEHQLQDIEDQFAWALTKCETETDREDEQLSLRERAEYELEAQEASAHAARIGMTSAYPTSR